MARATVVTVTVMRAALQEQHQDQVLRPEAPGVGGSHRVGLGHVVGGRPSSLPPQPAHPLTWAFSTPAGGFATFSSCFPGLCEGKPAALLPMSLSQPCLPAPSVGLTRILPHLYLGSQKDVLNKVCAPQSWRQPPGGPGEEDADTHGGWMWEKHGPGAQEHQSRAQGRAWQRWLERLLPAPLAAQPTCHTADVTGPLASPERTPCLKNGDEGRE